MDEVELDRTYVGDFFVVYTLHRTKSSTRFQLVARGFEPYPVCEVSRLDDSVTWSEEGREAADRLITRQTKLIMKGVRR